MNVISKKISVYSKGEGDILDITKKVSNVLIESKLVNGILTIFVSGSTGAIITLEYEAGLLNDIPNVLDRVAPRNFSYDHEKRWHDGNGHSHVKASLIGPSLTVPFIDGKLTLGTWQQIGFIELDVRNRSRTIVIQIIGK
jgi:secondary thiamine-phosphate synthase enzyme